MTNFTALYADIILKKIVTKIRKDTAMKNKATERKLANASGGRSYVLIHFKTIRRTFRVPVGKYIELTESATQANKKSLNIKLFEVYEVDIKDYLKGADEE